MWTAETGNLVPTTLPSTYTFENTMSYEKKPGTNNDCEKRFVWSGFSEKGREQKQYKEEDVMHKKS